MRKLVVLSFLLLCSCVMPGYAQDKEVTLIGRLILFGNEPFVVPNLQLENGENWELGGVSRAQAKQLQNQRLQVRGKVVRAPKLDPMGPRIEVREFTVVK